MSRGSGLFFAVSSVMKEFHTFVSRYDSLEISYVVVRPEGQPKAVLQLLHGMCGCKERFLPFMEFMAGQGVVCIANDHRGHGDSVKSADDLGYMYDGGYVALVDDVRQLNRMAAREWPCLPLYMLGHSMGSLALRTFLKNHTDRLDGVVICGSPAPNVLAHLSRVFSCMAIRAGMGRKRPVNIQSLASAAYNRNFRNEGPKAWICSDPEVRKAFLSNPRTDFVFTFNASNALMNMMCETYSPAGWTVCNPDMPVLFLSGADDPCMVGPKGLDKAVMKMRQAGYHDVSYKIYPAMRHEILNEIGKERVWQDILRFMGL